MPAGLEDRNFSVPLWAQTERITAGNSRARLKTPLFYIRKVTDSAAWLVQDAYICSQELMANCHT